jgi:hypothetical protein
LSRRQKELPLGDGFEHVCGLGKREDEMNICSNEVVRNKLGVATSDDSMEKTDKLGDAENGKVTSIVERDVTDVDGQQNGIFPHAESKLHADMEVTKPSVTEEQPEEEFDCRPRSPVHETSIVVPEVQWKTVGNIANGNDDDDDDDIATDSLSSSGSASDLEHSGSEHESKPSAAGIMQGRTPPRVEIHNSSGELMTEPVEDRPKTHKACDEIILPQSTEVINPIAASAEGGKKTTDISVSDHKSCDMTGDRSSTSTPPSTRDDDSESYRNEATLAETELSDWAQDAVVSEDLEDAEFNIDPQYVTVRRHRKPKTIRKSESELSTPVRIARSEDFDFEDGPGHICGIDRRMKNEQGPNQDFPSSATSRLFTNMDNIEFMDTGEEESGSDDVLGVANKALLHNSGYVQFVNAIDDEDLSTPVVETPTVTHKLLTTAIPPSAVLTECERDGNSLEMLDVLNQVEAVNRELAVASAGEEEENSLQPEGTTTEETTTSEIVTVKDSPVDVPQADTSGKDDVFYTPAQESTKSVDEAYADPFTPADDPTGTAYEEYVHRLQGRISPFSNVRDSIDVRKSRRRNKATHHQPRTQELIAEETEGTSSSPVLGSSFNSPGTSRKLEAILRERSKQKDLIHEMVMDKLLAQKKSPQEKKNKRLSRGPLNLFTQPQNCQPNTRLNSEDLNTGSCKEVPESPGSVRTVTDIKTDDTAKPLAGGLTTPERNQQHSIHQDLEVPFADASTPAGEETEQFYTPMTSFKKQARYLELGQRPLSIHASFRCGEHAEGSVSERNSSCLPETPLTNPEAFSLPDIRKALFNTSVEMLKTPVVPVRRRKEEARHALERERVREEARLRAHLKTDEELGLSPEDYIKILRQKVPKRHASDAGSGTKRHGILRSLSEPDEEQKMSECYSSSSIQDDPTPCDSNEHSSSTTPAVSRLSPSPVDTPLSSYQQLQTSSEGTSGVASPSSAPLSKVIKDFQFRYILP